MKEFCYKRIWSITAFFYFILSFILLCLFTKLNDKSILFILRPSPFNYFELLSEAFLNGRFNIIPKYGMIHDLSIFHNKYYLYWPPMPSIVLMPLVYFFGTQLPDKLISIFLSSINVYLIGVLLYNFSRLFKLNLKKADIGILVFFWALGTVNFNLAFEGSVWYISQVFSQTFILLAYQQIFKKNYNLFISGIFFAAAVYTRNTIVFSGISFLFLIYIHSNLNVIKTFKQALKFGIPFMVCTFLNFIYNLKRFGNIFDNGLDKHNMGFWFRKDFENYGFFNLHFMPKNLYYEIFKLPTLKFNFPFINFDLEGFGMLWLSPIFLLLPLAIYFFIREKERITKTFIAISIIVSFCTLFLISMIMGRGVQFGARYSLDFLIQLFFILAFILSKYSILRINKILFYVILFWTVFVNTVGAYYMCSTW